MYKHQQMNLKLLLSKLSKFHGLLKTGVILEGEH